MAKRDKGFRRVPLLIVLLFVSIIIYCCGSPLLNYMNPAEMRFQLFFMSIQLCVVFSSALSTIILNVVVVGPVIILSYLFRSGFHAPDAWYFNLINMVMAATLCVTLSWYYSRIIISNLISRNGAEEARDRFQEESIRDALTGLNNRRSFDQSIEFYINVCFRVHQTVCAIMLDVDYFKNYNDKYGHPAGDNVLRAVGKLLTDMGTRDGLYTARVGGEEFMVLWNENRIDEAKKVALELRERIHALHIPHADSITAPIVTVSQGLYVMRGGTKSTAQLLYETVDQALYLAKDAGRDCIVLIDSAQPEPQVLSIVPSAESGRKLVMR
jgi:diguanylate cyclase (GGDEF)-like protein